MLGFRCRMCFCCTFGKMQQSLESTYYFDIESTEIQQLVADFRELKPQEQIKELYLYVRDGWRYNPFVIGIDKAHYVASHIYKKPEAHCIDKAVLYVAGLRALGIPARLRLAKVSNHIAVERLVAKMGTNEIAPHGLAEVYLNGKWTKCSPAFNKELCEMYRVAPLDFDGTADSIFQEYNNDNDKFMAYEEDYGSFEDVPYEFIVKVFRENYPELYNHYITHGKFL